MGRFIVCFLFLLLCNSMHAQRDAKHNVARIDSLILCAHRDYNNVELLSSMENALEAYSLSEAANYSEGRAKSNFYIAQVLSSVGDYNQSLEYLKKSEKEKFTARTPLFHSEVSRLQGRVLSLLGLHRSSVEVFKKGLALIMHAERSNETDYLLSMAYENLSIVYNILHMSDSSLYYLEQNRELLESMDEEVVYRNLINLYGQYGWEFIERENYDSAAYYLDQGMLLAEKYQFPYTAYIYRRQGEMETRKGNLPLAIDYYQKAISNTLETGISRGLTNLYQFVSDAYAGLDQPDSSRHYLDKKWEAEVELSQTNVNALDNAVLSLLEEERMKQSSRYRSTLLRWGIALTLALLIVFTWWVHRSWRHKKHLLIYLHFSSKEIAQILFIEHRSVQTRKNRLRKKLKLSANTDLYQYLREMGGTMITKETVAD